MKVRVLIALMLVAVCGHAQNANSIEGKTIQWKSSAYVDRLTNDRVEASNTFVITDNVIEWNQASEDAKQVFTIKNVENKWNDLNQDGYVQYQFDCYNTSGSLTVQRQNGELSLSIEIHNLPSGSLNLFFEISQMTY